MLARLRAVAAGAEDGLRHIDEITARWIVFAAVIVVVLIAVLTGLT